MKKYMKPVDIPHPVWNRLFTLDPITKVLDGTDIRTGLRIAGGLNVMRFTGNLTNGINEALSHKRYARILP